MDTSVYSIVRGVGTNQLIVLINNINAALTLRNVKCNLIAPGGAKIYNVLNNTYVLLIIKLVHVFWLD